MAESYCRRSIHSVSLLRRCCDLVSKPCDSPRFRRLSDLACRAHQVGRRARDSGTANSGAQKRSAGPRYWASPDSEAPAVGISGRLQPRRNISSEFGGRGHCLGGRGVGALDPALATAGLELGRGNLSVLVRVDHLEIHDVRHGHIAG